MPETMMIVNIEDSPDEDSYGKALLAGLEGYELDEDDQALLAGVEGASHGEPEAIKKPVVAIVGRPNVGKSALVNRIIGRREAVVQDTPGVTRDRVTYEAEWAGEHFHVVDTGGWERDAKGLGKRVAEQAEIAIELADVVVFVVDAIVGATDADDHVVRLLRKSQKPTILAANKVDAPHQEADALALWNLGLGEPVMVSALHGRGAGDLLDRVIASFPQESPIPGSGGGPRRVALVGRPNVGKSSLLNKLAGQQRVVVDDVPGTTRDPVDELITLDSRPWRFIDTAGIRRRVHQTKGADFYASLRTQAALEKAEVALVLIDAAEPLSEQDVRIIQQVVDAGRALVLIFNKWDLLDEERRFLLEREIDLDLGTFQWAPRVNLSAHTGRHTDRLAKAMDTALQGWETRVPTGQLNAFISELVAAHPHPVRGGKQPRILFATQAATAPPRFVIFATGFLEANYRRFIERRLREDFGFIGSPISMSVRVRQRKRR